MGRETIGFSIISRSMTVKDTPNKMNGNSLDISAGNHARLKSLFPTVFTETVNDKGELVEGVDFEKLKAGLKPTEKVQTVTLAGIPVFSIADGGVLIGIADAVTKELINAVAEAEPLQFICLDKAFGGNDQRKANAVQTFNAHNMDKEKHNQIKFKTA